MEQEILINALNDVINKEVEKRVAEKVTSSEMTFDKFVENLATLSSEKQEEFFEKLLSTNDLTKILLINYIKDNFPEKLELQDYEIKEKAQDLDDSDIIEIVANKGLERDIVDNYLDNCSRSDIREILNNIFDTYI